MGKAKKQKISKRERLLNKVFSTAIIKVLSLPTMDGTKLAYGDARKVLKYTMHLLKDEMQKKEIECNAKDDSAVGAVGFEIRALSRDEWKNLLTRD